jgi:hypothetical protein
LRFDVCCCPFLRFITAGTASTAAAAAAPAAPLLLSGLAVSVACQLAPFCDTGTQKQMIGLRSNDAEFEIVSAARCFCSLTPSDKVTCLSPVSETGRLHALQTQL